MSNIKVDNLISMTGETINLQNQSQSKTYDMIDMFTTGWIPANETWSYLGAESPTFTMSVTGDVTTKHWAGQKVKLSQSQALTSYWTFDSNLTDSVGSNHGTAIGGAASGAGGKFNNGLTLNGSSQAVTLADVANLRPTGDFTVGFWINSSYVANHQYVIQNMISVTSNFYGFWIATAITTGYVSLTTGSGTPLISGNAFSGTVNVCNGSWHYVVVTVKNNWGQIYVDGVLDGSGHISSPVYYSTVGNSYSSIGANRQGVSTYSYWLSGKIDDLFFINGSVPNARDVQAKYVAATAQGTGLMSILPDKKMRLYTSGNLDIVGVIREVTSIT